MSFKNGDKVRIKDLILRPEWNGHIATVCQEGSGNIKIEEFINDSQISPWIAQDRAEKIVDLPQELFQI